MRTYKRSKSKRNKRTRRTKKVGGGNFAKKLQKMRITCQQKVAKATTPIKKAELSHELAQKIEVLQNCKAKVDNIPVFENLPQVKGVSSSFGKYNTPKKASGSMGFSSSFGKHKSASGSMGFANADESL